MNSTRDTGIITVPQTRHVVFIGETGAGKSSVINLFADRECATTSPDAIPCTRDFASYEVSIEGRTYRLWDTPGLNEASGFRIFRRSTRVESLKRFLRERHRLGELDLLVFCVGESRAHKGMSRAYKIFGHATRQIAIPVVIAITHLERKQPTMEAWWQDNERRLGDLGWASQQDIRFLIAKEYRKRAQSISSDREYLNNPNDRSCVVC